MHYPVQADTVFECFSLREKADEPGAVKTRSPRERLEHDDGGGKALRCRICRSKITETTARTEADGSHRHTFFNPHGHVFEIGCFARAPGCAVISEATTEFTWFPGRAWRIVVCRGCRAHMGWRFSPESAGSSFFGLILDMLVEEADDET